LHFGRLYEKEMTRTGALGLLAHVLFLARIVVGTIAGIGMVIGAIRICRRIGNARPSQPTHALATTGVFGWTRNPMYVCRRQPAAPRHRRFHGIGGNSEARSGVFLSVKRWGGAN